jgi:hypothetical protein
MLREPRKTQQTQTPAVRTTQKKSRFQLEKLEERIAPAVHTNPHGKTVGDGSKVYGK